jgi:hypothetical protein
MAKLEWRMKKTRMNTKEGKCEEMERIEIPEGQLAGPSSRYKGFITSRFYG